MFIAGDAIHDRVLDQRGALQRCVADWFVECQVGDLAVSDGERGMFPSVVGQERVVAFGDSGKHCDPSGRVRLVGWLIKDQKRRSPRPSGNAAVVEPAGRDRAGSMPPVCSLVLRYTDDRGNARAVRPRDRRDARTRCAVESLFGAHTFTLDTAVADGSSVTETLPVAHLGPPAGRGQSPR